MSDEKKISGRYRELPREEPPRALDDAILAASRRAVKGRNRWYVPLAAAAVIVLAVAVTVHVERDQPGEEIVSAVEPKPFAVEPPPPPALRSESRMRENVAKAEQQARRKEKAAAAPSAPPAQDAMGALAKRADEAKAPPGVRAAREELGIPGSAGPLPALAQATPEQRLQGIADLRRQGRHEDADKALAEFRRAYPQYRITEEMRAKVEREPARAR
jgi:hypothetical protein